MARRGQKAPLVPMPIIGKPFEQIAINIIGPLPQKSNGNQYVLVITDYATRYLEAYALRNASVVSVAEKLIDLFSRHRIPKEFLTDQGINFMSDLLQEVHTLVGISDHTIHKQMDCLKNSTRP